MSRDFLKKKKKRTKNTIQVRQCLDVLVEKDQEVLQL